MVECTQYDIAMETGSNSSRESYVVHICSQSKYTALDEPLTVKHGVKVEKI